MSEDKSIVGKFQDKLSGIAHVVHDIAKGNDQKSSLARHESSLLGTVDIDDCVLCLDVM